MDIEDFLLAAAGPAMQRFSMNDVARRQNAINDRSTAYRGAQSARSMAATQTLIESLNPAAVRANDAAAKAELAANLRGTVDMNRQYQAGPNYGGKMSDRYGRRVASNNADNAERIKRTIEQLSTIGAPALRGQEDARRFSTAANTVAQSNTAANNVGQRYNEAIGTVRGNPLYDFGAELLNGMSLLRSRNKAKGRLPIGQTLDAYSPGYLGGTSEGE